MACSDHSRPLLILFPNVLVADGLFADFMAHTSPCSPRHHEGPPLLCRSRPPLLHSHRESAAAALRQQPVVRPPLLPPGVRRQTERQTPPGRRTATDAAARQPPQRDRVQDVHVQAGQAHGAAWPPHAGWQLSWSCAQWGACSGRSALASLFLPCWGDVTYWWLRSWRAADQSRAAHMREMTILTMTCPARNAVARHTCTV